MTDTSDSIRRFLYTDPPTLNGMPDDNLMVKVGFEAGEDHEAYESWGWQVIRGEVDQGHVSLCTIAADRNLERCLELARERLSEIYRAERERRADAGEKPRCGGTPGNPAWRTVMLNNRHAAANGPCLGCPDCRPEEVAICPKCGAVACGHGMEPVSREEFARIHRSRQGGGGHAPRR